MFSARDRAALHHVRELTLHVRVNDDVFQTLASHFNTQQVVEITALASAYNLVSRFLVALRIQPEQQQQQQEGQLPPSSSLGATATTPIIMPKAKR